MTPRILGRTTFCEALDTTRGGRGTYRESSILSLILLVTLKKGLAFFVSSHLTYLPEPSKFLLIAPGIVSSL